MNQPTLANPEAFYQQVWQLARQAFLSHVW
jgi:hypothetical protein